MHPRDRCCESVLKGVFLQLFHTAIPLTALTAVSYLVRVAMILPEEQRIGSSGEPIQVNVPRSNTPTWKSPLAVLPCQGLVRVPHHPLEVWLLGPRASLAVAPLHNLKRGRWGPPLLRRWFQVWALAFGVCLSCGAVMLMPGWAPCWSGLWSAHLSPKLTLDLPCPWAVGWPQLPSLSQPALVALWHCL